MKKVTEYDLKGEVANFPLEVLQKMCERQAEQGNLFIPEVFQKIRASSSEEDGFDWGYTPEGHMFWKQVIVHKDFNLFFEKYPRTEPTDNGYPQVMEVSDDGQNWGKRVVFAEKCGHYIAWNAAQTINQAEKEYHTSAWKYAREIEPVEKMTLEQVCKELGRKIKIVEGDNGE